jgi:putative ABC transport system permease protein
VRVLKPGIYKGKGKGALQNVLIVFQFLISAMLIIVSLHMVLQFRYIDNKNLGFESENVLVINAEGSQVQQGMTGIRNALMQKPFVKEVSFCSQAPSSGYYGDLVFENRITEEPLRSFIIDADSNYFEVFDIQLLAGRNFSRSAFLDSNRAEYIINETAVKNMGLNNPEEAIGLDYRYPFDTISTYSKIVGVMEDFHFRDLQHEIEALSLSADQEDFIMISIRFQDVEAEDAITAIQNIWQKELPGAVFNHYLLDERISLLYRDEQRLLDTLIIFSVFAILVATLGLIGLSAFITRQRKKEIGIRKVLGANVKSILRVFIMKFIWLVIFANLIAAPLAYLFVDSWFAGFAYHIGIQWWVFVVSLLLTALIAMTATISQVLRSAWLNPVESIKYE